MRQVLFICILIAIDLYAFQALKVVMMHWSRSSRSLMITSYFLSTVLLVGYVLGGRTILESGPKVLQIYLTAFIFILFISKLPIAIFVLIDDLRRLVMFFLNQIPQTAGFDLGRSKVISKFAMLVGAIPLIGLSYGMIRNQYRYRLHRSRVMLPSLPKGLEGLRIVQISDIHSGSFTFKEPIANGIEMINDLDADLVMFTGDLVNTEASEMQPYLDIFSRIKSKYGVYSILGNHDYGDYKAWPSAGAKMANLERLKETHRALGWNLLLNESVTIDINAEKLAIIGVENISASPRFRSYGNLNQASQGTSDAGLRILLSHDPSHWAAEVLSNFKDIELTLSGHTHGFQFGLEIPGWVKWSPSKYVYKQWAGLYSENHQHLYVNRGFGTLGYPGRVGILPEITLIELKSA